MSYANRKAWRDVCKYWETWYRGRVDTFVRRSKSGRLDELLKGFHGSGETEVLSTPIFKCQNRPQILLPINSHARFNTFS